MKRRSFIVATGAALAVAAWPPWLRRAFSDASIAAHGKAVAGTQARARATGRPIFAIVVPQKDDDKDERGHRWGEYLNHASPSQLAPLGLAEVVCAPLRDLPSSPQAREGETLALVIEPDGAIQALTATLPDVPLDGKEHEEITYQRIARLAELVHRGLAADGKMLARRAAAVRAVLGPDAPAVTELSPRNVAALAATVETKLKKAPPPGAHWASGGFCGPPMVEDMKETDPLVVGCGMGHLSRLSQRFLYFYTKTPGQLWRERWAAEDKK